MNMRDVEGTRVVSKISPQAKREECLKPVRSPVARIGEDPDDDAIRSLDRAPGAKPATAIGRVQA
jgi:hypothetical protein